MKRFTFIFVRDEVPDQPIDPIRFAAWWFICMVALVIFGSIAGSV